MRRVSFWIIFGLTVAAAAPPGVVGAQSVKARPVSATRSESTATIHGSAVDSDNAAMASRDVRLRNARTGQLAARLQTDKAGAFEFRSIDPGSYIVELMGRDNAVVAASDIVSVDAGTRVSALVKMPFRQPPLGGILGRSLGSAVLVTAAAASAGVLATQVTGEPVSPRQ